METTTNVKTRILSLVLLTLLLGGCARGSASYSISAEFALSIVREKVYLWDETYQRSITVMSRPKCITRYKMPPDPGDVDKVELFHGGDGYFVLRDKLGQYVTNLADCSMTQVEEKIKDPGTPVGHFEVLADQSMRFVPLAIPVPSPAPANTHNSESEKVAQ